MTKVTFYQDSENAVMGFKAAGHAGYAEHGEDIICAAISALVINTVNSIEAFARDKFLADVDESGEISLRLEARPSKEAALLLNSLILGLQRMEEEEENRQYIDVIFEEV